MPFNAVGKMIADRYTWCMQGIKCLKFIKSNWGWGAGGWKRRQFCPSNLTAQKGKAPKEENTFVYEMRPDCSETLYTGRNCTRKFVVCMLTHIIIADIKLWYPTGMSMSISVPIYICATVWQPSNCEHFYLRKKTKNQKTTTAVWDKKQNKNQQFPFDSFKYN